MWGILGNEKADAAAKSALSLPVNQSINQTRQFLTRRNTAKPLQGRNRTRPPRPTL